MEQVTMVMGSERTYTATRLKAQLLGVLDAVQASGESVVVTKHGRAVARIVPLPSPAALAESVTFLVADEERSRPSTSAGALITVIVLDTHAWLWWVSDPT